MSFLSWETETVTIDLEDGEGNKAWVRVKKYASRADRDYALSQAMRTRIRFGVDGAQPQMESEFDMGAGQLALLERMIVDWSFTFPEGHPQAGEKVPVTPEYIGRLREDVAAAIVAEINRNNPRRSQEEIANLLGASSATSRQAKTGTIVSPSSTPRR